MNFRYRLGEEKLMTLTHPNLKNVSEIIIQHVIKIEMRRISDQRPKETISSNLKSCYKTNEMHLFILLSIEVNGIFLPFKLKQSVVPKS